MIGSLLLLLFQCIITPPYALLLALCIPMSPAQRFGVVTGWTSANVWAARFFCGIHYQWEGLENLPKGRFIVAAKHSSTWETFALASRFSPAAFIAKRELLWVPFFGWGFALASPITINRSAGPQAMGLMVAQGQKRLKQGFNIMIFPEGTRIEAGTRGKYKTGCARLAIGLANAGEPLLIVPISHNAGYLWPKKSLRKLPGIVTVRVLPPIDPKGRDVAELTREIEETIEAEVARIGPP